MRLTKLKSIDALTYSKIYNQELPHSRDIYYEIVHPLNNVVNDGVFEHIKIDFMKQMGKKIEIDLGEIEKAT
jgi:hypothetical protein